MIPNRFNKHSLVYHMKLNPETSLRSLVCNHCFVIIALSPTRNCLFLFDSCHASCGADVQPTWPCSSPYNRCVCPDGFTGDKCEMCKSTKLVLHVCGVLLKPCVTFVFLALTFLSLNLVRCTHFLVTFHATLSTP